MYKYSKKWLIDLLESGSNIDYLFFWGHSNPDNNLQGKFLLSQWYPVPFFWEGIEYISAEHWMMAEKARLFGDTQKLEQILVAPSAKQAKALGREVSGFDSRVWEAASYEIVVEGNIRKFEQNANARRFLLSTDDKVIVEASPVDAIWGIGHSEESTEARDPRKWRGSNLLGFALMETRDRIK
jgi:ribA/ribD-fused uncharacterized protein